MRTVTPVSQSDETLVRQLARGNMEALGELYQRHVGMVEGAVKRFAPYASPSEVEDLAQEVFLKLQPASAGYVEQAKFKAWLYGIAVRTTLSWRKKHAVRHRLFSRSKSALADDLTVSPSPERTAALRELIRKLFRQLPKRQQDVLVLYEGEGFTAREVADILSTTEAAVWTRIHRARRTLMHALDRSDVEAMFHGDTPYVFEVRP